MSITPLPTPPSRSDSANFAERGDAFMSALPNFAVEAEAARAQVVTKEASAVSSASTATTKASEASASASAALTSKNAAATSATSASTSAATATTKAAEASASAAGIAGHIGSGGAAHAAATAAAAGFLSAADKTKLDAITGTNTGDETATTIKSKLGIATLSGSNTGDQTNITGNAGTATALSAGADRTKLDAITGTNTGDETATTIKTKLGIATLSGANTGDQTNITGNAGTATKLATARTINGASFDGSADIVVSNSVGEFYVSGVLIREYATSSIDVTATLSASSLVGGIVLSTPSSAAITLTLPTYVNIAALLPSIPIGSGFSWSIQNNAASVGTITIAPNTGSGFGGNNASILPKETALFITLRQSVSSVATYRVG